MASIEKLYERFEEVRNLRKRNIQEILTYWLEENFLDVNRQWKEKVVYSIGDHFIGKKVATELQQYKEKGYYYWPSLPDKDIKDAIEDLGFQITDDLQQISGPIFKKEGSLTFAQSYVKKINDNYLKKLEEEKEKAKEYFEKLIFHLYNQSEEDYEFFNNHILVRTEWRYGSMFPKATTVECYKYFQKYLTEYDIKESYEDGKYIGIEIKYQN